MQITEILPRLFGSVETIDSGTTDVEVDLKELSTLLVSVRRHLHMHPEVGFAEFETAAFVREVLEIHGLTVTGPLAGTGLYTDIHGSSPGRAIGYRADIDALPITDRKDVPYASTIPGVGHLCGHDAHTAVAIGTALLLHRHRDEFSGTVRVFFQPNEEGMPSGAPRMIEDGVLDGLEAVYALHVDPTLEAGRFGLIHGPVTAAADQFQIMVKGPATGHSARPHQSVDTVWIATQIMNTLYQYIGRRTDARSPAVLTICRLHGGEAFNVIPDSVEIGGSLRTTDPDDRVQIRDFIRSSAERTAQMFGGEADVVIHYGSPALLNDRRLIALADRVITDRFGADAVYNVPVPSMGSEDFAHYTQLVPGALIRLGTSSGPETSHTLHDGSFDLDEDTLAPAALLMKHLLLSHLTDTPVG